MNFLKRFQRRHQPSTTSPNSAVRADHGHGTLLPGEELMDTSGLDVQELPWMLNRMGSKTSSVVNNGNGREKLLPGKGFRQANGPNVTVNPSVFNNNPINIYSNQPTKNRSQEVNNISAIDIGYKGALTTLVFGQPFLGENKSGVGMETRKRSFEEICRREQAERVSIALSVCSDDEDLDRLHVPSFSSSMSAGEVTCRIRAINWDVDDGTTTQENGVQLENHANGETNKSWVSRLFQRFKLPCFN